MLTKTQELYVCTSQILFDIIITAATERVCLLKYARQQDDLIIAYPEFVSHILKLILKGRQGVLVIVILTNLQHYAVHTRSDGHVIPVLAFELSVAGRVKWFLSSVEFSTHVLRGLQLSELPTNTLKETNCYMMVDFFLQMV